MTTARGGRHLSLAGAVGLGLTGLLAGCGGPFLSVTVIWSAGGAPVNNAQVCLGQGENEQCANTDSNGIAEIDVGSMPNGAYYIYAWRPGATGRTNCTTHYSPLGNGGGCVIVQVSNPQTPSPLRIIF